MRDCIASFRVSSTRTGERAMSALLESLLDLPRAAACALHEAESAHHPFCSMPEAGPRIVGAPRACAIEALISEPREYRFEVIRAGEREEIHHRTCAGDVEVELARLELAADGATCRAWPVMEITFEEGRDAYPRPLHRCHGGEAESGWCAAARQQRRHDAQQHRAPAAARDGGFQRACAVRL
ncbi:MAG: hypothetical protein JWQ76_5252 [Ramlibacter sp.]|nr:hypothetical protein [Ramlibacter sp.]